MSCASMLSIKFITKRDFFEKRTNKHKENKQTKMEQTHKHKENKQT